MEFVVTTILCLIMPMGGVLLAWLLGLFNPIGYVGVLPWKVEAEKERREREGRM